MVSRVLWTLATQDLIEKSQKTPGGISWHIYDLAHKGLSECLISRSFGSGFEGAVLCLKCSGEAIPKCLALPREGIVSTHKGQ